MTHKKIAEVGSWPVTGYKASISGARQHQNLFTNQHLIGGGISFAKSALLDIVQSLAEIFDQYS